MTSQSRDKTRDSTKHDTAKFGIDLYSKAILKFSCKNIEKWLKNKKFVGIDYANVAN